MSYEEQNNLEKPGYRDKYRFDKDYLHAYAFHIQLCIVI